MSGLSNLDQSTFKSLETLRQFESFFDMVSNPTKYAEIVKEAKNTLAEAKAIVEAYTTVDLANEYLTKAKVFANEKTAEIEAKVQAAQEASAKRQAQIEAMRLEADKVVAQANAMFAEADQVQKKQNEAISNINARQGELNLRADELYKKEVQLQEKEKELNQKSAKLKEILG